MSARKLFGNVYAIIRIDDYLPSSVPIEERVKVTSVVPDAATAAEVERLMALKAGRGCRYFSQATRLADSATAPFGLADDEDR